MSAPSNFARNEAAAPVGGPAGAIEASMASGSGGAGEIGGDGVRLNSVRYPPLQPAKSIFFRHFCKFKHC